MLTARGWWLFLIVLALLTLGLAVGIRALTLVALTLLTWFLWNWLTFAFRVRRAARHWHVVRTLEDARGPVDTLWARQPVTVRVALENSANASFAFVSAIDRVPTVARKLRGRHFVDGQLAPDEPLELTYRIECPAPGRLRFEGLKVRLADLQGFFVSSLFVRSVEIVRVLPPLADARGQVPAVKRLNLIPLMGTHRHRRPGSGSELLDLRDYLPGDPPKLIAWKASARRDRLMTKELESEVPIRCTLFVDTSNSVRLGQVGRTALVRLVEIAAAVVQASAAARDLTGLCLFDEDGVRAMLRPARGRAHLAQVMNRLTDAADLFPQGPESSLVRLVPLTFGVLQDLYPEFLERDVNHVPWWLPFWSPQPHWTKPLKIRIPRGRMGRFMFWLYRRLRELPLGLGWVIEGLAGLYRRLPALPFWRWFRGPRLNVWDLRHYRWRKQVSAALSVYYGLDPGGLALLMEDDDLCLRTMQRFLAEHQVPFPLPLYDVHGNYLFTSKAKIDALAGALVGSVLHGRDNELFVLLVDLLEAGPALAKLLGAARVALGRHHQVVVICPWPAGVPLPGRTAEAYQPLQLSLQETLFQANTARLHQAFAVVKQAFARLEVPVICAADDDAIPLILRRMKRLRGQAQGVR